jgi:DNA-directed RNA polymerase specialized sigma24 family protein
LPAEQRNVFILNELEGKTFAEIAVETGENIKTLISRKGYAVKHLRKRLQILYDEFMNY